MENRWSRILAALIRVCGFVWANPDIIGERFSFFPALSDEPVEIPSIKPALKLCSCATLTVTEIANYFDGLGYRQATLQELLCWWYKDMKARWTESTVVVALGSVGLNRFGNECSPYIYCWRGEPKLGLLKRSYVITEVFSFAVVRKWPTQ